MLFSPNISPNNVPEEERETGTYFANMEGKKEAGLTMIRQNIKPIL